jgi:hypothetical protein
VHSKGLHYNGAGDGSAPEDVFVSELTLMHAALARTRALVAYMSHYAQHYSTHMGWYRLWGASDNKKECERIAGSVRDADRHTRWLANLVLPRVHQRLVAPPWEDLGMLACKKGERGSTEGEVYFVPQFDLTFALERLHLSRRLKGEDRVIMDCTHYVGVLGGNTANALFDNKRSASPTSSSARLMRFFGPCIGKRAAMRARSRCCPRLSSPPGWSRPTSCTRTPTLP